MKAICDRDLAPKNLCAKLGKNRSKRLVTIAVNTNTQMNMFIDIRDKFKRIITDLFSIIFVFSERLTTTDNVLSSADKQNNNLEACRVSPRIEL